MQHKLRPLLVHDRGHAINIGASIVYTQRGASLLAQREQSDCCNVTVFILPPGKAWVSHIQCPTTEQPAVQVDERIAGQVTATLLVAGGENE